MRAQADRRIVLAVALLSIVVVCPTQAFAQDTVTSARQLYGEAAYEEALAMLDRLKLTSLNGEAQAVEQYRALCLLALGRGGDAEKAIEAVIESNASYMPDPVTTSPRVQAAFRDVRRKLLPRIAQQRYVSAKSAFDRKDYWSALEGFDSALTLIGPPDEGLEGNLLELRSLIVGFRDLARAAMPVTSSATAVAQKSVEDVLPPPPPPPRREFYGPSDKDVVPPVAINQRMPRWTGQPLAMLNDSNRNGIIEVNIAVNGVVESAVLRQQTGTYYDQELLDAAREWKYSPATRSGTPVKYRKVIQFTIQ
jgi:TonB family protein